MFITFDGIDGVGKSTQMAMLCDALRERGHDVVACRDPGSTAVGEAVRDILLHRREMPIARRAEMLLYMAARAQLVDQIIKPALAAGKIVVCDRYLLANVVYQGHAGGLDPATVWQVGGVATDGVEPTLTFLLDMPIAAADQRIARPTDRMESQGDAYRARLREGYLHEAARQPERILVVNADRPVAEVAAEILSAALGLLSRRD